MSTTDEIAELAGAKPDGATAAALDGRSDIFAMTAAAEQAVLAPREPGGLPHGLRRALAARIARLHGADDLAIRYAADSAEPAADPAFDGGGDPRLSAILAFSDTVSARPRDADGREIEALKAAGIPDADIVRLAELNAFVAYQMRVIEGIRLMAATA